MSGASRSMSQAMTSDSPGLFSPCPFSGWPRAISGSTSLSQLWGHLLCESRDSCGCHSTPPPPALLRCPHTHHVPRDLGYLGDCALSLFQHTHSHSLSLPGLGEISRPDQVTLSQVQTGSWVWGSLWGLFLSPVPTHRVSSSPGHPKALAQA